MNIHHLISKKLKSTHTAFPWCTLALGLCISRHTRFPTAGWGIVSCMPHTYTACEEQTESGTDSVGSTLSWDGLGLLPWKWRAQSSHVPSALTASLSGARAVKGLRTKCQLCESGNREDTQLWGLTTVCEKAEQRWLLLCLYWNYEQERNLAPIQQLIAASKYKETQSPGYLDKGLIGEELNENIQYPFGLLHRRLCTEGREILILTFH